jgi:hypothetical protein
MSLQADPVQVADIGLKDAIRRHLFFSQAK